MIILRLAFLLLSLVQPENAQAQEETPSLFFSPEQIRQIDSLSVKSRSVEAKRSDQIIHLDSLLYFGNDRWSVRLEGHIWTPETTSQTIIITKVTPDSVTIKLKNENGDLSRAITLRPNQSYNRLTGKISEGPHSAATGLVVFSK